MSCRQLLVARYLNSYKPTSKVSCNNKNISTKCKWITTLVCVRLVVPYFQMMLEIKKKKRYPLILPSHIIYVYLIVNSWWQEFSVGYSVAKTRWRLAGPIWKGIREPVTTLKTGENGTSLRLCYSAPLQFSPSPKELVYFLLIACIFLFFVFIFCFNDLCVLGGSSFSLWGIVPFVCKNT